MAESYDDLVVGWLRDHGDSTLSDISEGIGVESRRIQHSLAMLVRYRMIHVSGWALDGSIRARVYALGDDKDAPEPPTHQDMVLTALRGMGSGTTLEIGRAVSIETQSAYNALSKLQDKGLVARSGLSGSSAVWTAGCQRCCTASDGRTTTPRAAPPP